MSNERQDAAPALGRGSKADRKQRLLTHGTPSITSSVAGAAILKDGNLFFVFHADGSTPEEDDHGHGLYYHDCRYLRGYKLRLAGKPPVLLGSSEPFGARVTLQLTNPDLQVGEELLKKESIGVRLTRELDGERVSVTDRLAFTNYSPQPVKLPVQIVLHAHFEDVFEVRGLIDDEPREVRRAWDGGGLAFVYDGRDGVRREVSAKVSARSERGGEDDRLAFEVELEPGTPVDVTVTLTLKEEGDGRGPGAAVGRRHSSDRRLADTFAELSGDRRWFNHIAEPPLRDLRALISRVDGQEYIAAGLPWFGTLFGRDSIISAYQVLAFDRGIAEQSLRLLAAYQGTREDHWRDEEPGKILHELRVGELARTGELPHTPYYGSVDATPLFLILLAEYERWAGDLRLFEDLRGAVEAAVGWLQQQRTSHPQGYIAYRSRSEHGLINQGWKDSGDAIVNADGSLAEPPIALVEAQAYAFAAFRGVAALYRRAGEEGRADELEREAENLRASVERDFWMDDEECYALALQRDGRQAAVVSSNAGHVLWSGLASPDRAQQVTHRLLADDMFTGWGVRTLSAKARRFNPVAYHLGTVWPHDNSIIAAGFRRYGQNQAYQQVANGIMDATGWFRPPRLPEVFAGFTRQEFGRPVHYPVACHPQAWAAGAIPYLLTTGLGLSPDAFRKRLAVDCQGLPHDLGRLEVKGVRVGDASVDLLVTAAGGGMQVEVTGQQGELTVEVRR